MRLRFLAAALFVTASSISLAVPLPIAYDIQLQARAQTGGSAFNMPSQSSWSSVSPQINNSGNVSFKVNVVAGGNPGVWFGGHGAGAIGYQASQDVILGDTWLNNNNVSVFTSSLGSQDGVYFHNGTSNMSGLLTNGPLGATVWQPRINDNGLLGSRTGFSGPQAYISYTFGPNTTATHAAEVGADPGSPYSFLFSCNFDNSRRIAGVVRVGPAGSSGDATRPDQLRLFNMDGTSSLIAEDKDSNAASAYFQFDSTTPGLNNNGFAAFIARTTAAASSRSVFLSNGTTTTTIAIPGVGLTSIDNFSPAVNDAGQVVFRATDLNGRISVFVGDGTTLQRVIGVNDSIMTDLGARTISSLAGNPDINDAGEVTFGVQLNSGGNAIYAAYVPEPGMISLLSVAFGATCLRRRAR